ncbi:MAG: 2-oxoacid:acceptor oxidoreductase family protein [Nitrospirae bacterium]|nr:2-oxoacid:acceptor oxidoreductase family protein [Nitrospirota bacterium]
MTESSPETKGIRTVTDGTGAAVWVETQICDGAAAYPITPSSNMGEGFQRAVADGKINLWGEKLYFMEPESEHSSASVCEGFAAAGGRVVNFTSGQGLILMKEVLYTIVGKRLPVVFHIASRPMTVHALNVHCGHDDVMGVTDVGWGIVFARNVQEVADLALIARRAAEDSETPFLVVQDGFLTSHTLETIHLPEPELMREFVGHPRERVRNLLDPNRALQVGVVQNQDAYMKGRIAQRMFSDKVAGILQKAVEAYADKTGRRLGAVHTYRMEDAEYALVGMGSLTETAEATADFLRERRNLKVGVVAVRTFRPFPSKDIVGALEKVKGFVVVERTDEPLSQSNPLLSQIKGAFYDQAVLTSANGRKAALPHTLSASAGMGSRDVRPEDLIGCIEQLREQSDPRQGHPEPLTTRALGILHTDSVKRGDLLDLHPAGSFRLRGHSVGGYGSITTNKIIATIVSEVFNLCVQAYPRYGGEKKGLPTNYYLVAAKEPVRIHSELKHVDFVALNDAAAFHTSNPMAGLRPQGTIFMHTDIENPEQVWAQIPENARRKIASDGLRVLYLDTVKLARETAPRADLMQRMQGIALIGVFLKVCPFKTGLSEDELFAQTEKALSKYVGKRGAEVVKANMLAIRRAYAEVHTLPLPEAKAAVA